MDDTETIMFYTSGLYNNFSTNLRRYKYACMYTYTYIHICTYRYKAYTCVSRAKIYLN